MSVLRRQTGCCRQACPFVKVRDPGKFTLVDSSIQVVAGDLGDDVAVAEALKGIDRALIVMGNHPDQARLERRFVDLGGSAGVSHLVKISSMEASAEATADYPKIITTPSSILWHRA